MRFCILLIMALLSFPLLGTDLHDELALEFYKLSYSDSLIYHNLDKVIKPEVNAHIDSLVENWFKDTGYLDGVNKELSQINTSYYRLEEYLIYCIQIIKKHYTVEDLKEIINVSSNQSGNVTAGSLLQREADNLADANEAFEEYLKKIGEIKPASTFPKNPLNSEVTEESPHHTCYHDVWPPPKPLSEIKPVYPEAARIAKLEATVVLEVEILRDGSVGMINVKRSYPAFDEAAKEAVRKVKFKPAILNNEPVDCMVIIPIEFQLNRK